MTATMSEPSRSEKVRKWVRKKCPLCGTGLRMVEDADPKSLEFHLVCGNDTCGFESFIWVKDE